MALDTRAERQFRHADRAADEAAGFAHGSGVQLRRAVDHQVLLDEIQVAGN